MPGFQRNRRRFLINHVSCVLAFFAHYFKLDVPFSDRASCGCILASRAFCVFRLFTTTVLLARVAWSDYMWVDSATFAVDYDSDGRLSIGPFSPGQVFVLRAARSSLDNIFRRKIKATLATVCLSHVTVETMGIHWEEMNRISGSCSVVKNQG